MAPSSGSRGLQSPIVFRFIFILLLTFHGIQGAQIAKSEYFMDRESDCIFAGYLFVERDQTVTVKARSPTPLTLPRRSCTIKFMPNTNGDTLKVYFERGSSINDCDVSLTVTMTDDMTFQMGCESPASLPTMEKQDGYLTIALQRSSFSDIDYSFTLSVRAERTLDPANSQDSDSDLDVGVIVGIVAGVIVFIVIVCVICIFCFLRRRKADKFEGGMVVPPKNEYENKMIKNGTGQANTTGSTTSDSQLLIKNEEARGRGRSALDRFGPVEPRQQKMSKDNYSDVDVEPSYKERQRERTNNASSDDVKRSPILSALHSNPKFRRSFHENEVDAEDRARRVSERSENSSESMNSRGVPLPPKLPPVPKSPPRSPSPHRRGEKIAMISRDRPLSSSSDLARQIEENATPDELSEDEPRKSKKADTRHTLRPNRGEKKKSTRDENSDSEEERRRRRREKERRERERQEEEDEEEKRRRRRKREERRRREEEEDEEEERRQRYKRNEQDREYEGRFKKSASGRKSKGKAPRIGRSRSTGNALDEMENNHQRSRSKSPSSVRSLNFVEDDDDDDLDSNYQPFKRSGSKTSLYASRSSLYGRRRKNSMGETISLSSYAFDDVDSRFGDFDKRGLSNREKDRMFKSTGELEMHGATAQVVRECATQTGGEKTVYIYGRKTIAKSRPGRMYSRGSQTGTGRERRDSTGSARSAKSGRSSRSNARLKHKSRSQESLSRRRRSRSRHLGDSDDSDDRRSQKSYSRSKYDDYTDDSEDDRRSGKRRHHRSKSRDLNDDESDRGRGRPRPHPRKSGAASFDLSDSDGRSDGGKSGAASSIAASMAHPPPQVNPYGPQFVPVMYPPGQMAYMPTAPGGPPMASAAGAKPVVPPKPTVAPKPQKSKWDTLVEMTEGEKNRPRHNMDSPTETESMLSSAFAKPNHAYGGGPIYAPPSYTTAQKYPHPNSSFSSAYPDSSGLPQSARGPRQHKLDSYTPSESMI